MSLYRGKGGIDMKLVKYLIVAVVGLLLGGTIVYIVSNPQGEVPCSDCTNNENLDKSNAIGDVYFQKVGIDENNPAQLEELISKFGLSERALVKGSAQPGVNNNMYAFIYGEEVIKNIYLYDIDTEKLAALDYNYVEYMATVDNGILVEAALPITEAVVLEVLETESIPASLISFEINDTTYYWVIQFDGAGNKPLIEDIHVVQ